MVKTVDEIQDLVQENLAAAEAVKEAKRQKRIEYLAAQRAIFDDPDLSGDQRREKFDALQEYIRLAGDPSAFEREWPEIRRAKLAAHLVGDPTVGAARRINF